MKYIKSLDGLRAIAILLVMFFHFFFILEIGWIGVQIFFVLSGFLITSILLDSKNYSFSFYTKRFYWRRSLRIFPLYFSYLLIIALLFFLTGIPDNFVVNAPYLFTYTFNLAPLFIGYNFDGFFTHFWSLAVEEQFYLIWPFIIYFLSRKQLRKLLIVLFICCPIVRYFIGEYLQGNPFYQSHEIGEIVYRFTFSHFDAFAAGAIIPVWNLQEKLKNYSKVIVLTAIIITLLFGCINFLSLEKSNGITGITSLGYPIGGMQNLQHVWSYTILNLLSSSIILFVITSSLNKKNIFVRILENNFLVLIGKISYGMYIFHWVIFVVYKKFVNQFIGHEIISFGVYFLIVFSVSYLSFFYFENKILRFKDILYMKKVRS